MARNANKKHCSATTAKGKRCRQWAMRGHTLCYAHARRKRLPFPGERRCTARTKRGKACRQWAMPGTEEQYGRLLCSSHVPAGDGRRAYTRLPAEEERRCKATTKSGGRCPHWAMRGHTVCHSHAEGKRRQEPGERRCTARTKEGKRCSNWAIWGTEEQYGRLLCPMHVPCDDRRKAYTRLPEEGERRCAADTKSGERCRRWPMRGHTLCQAHAEGSRLPGPGERRCVSVTEQGKQCPHWAVRGTEEQYGRLLCAVHLPAGDPRKNYTRMPAEGERRCTATNLDNQQCRRWALVQDEEGRDLCWLHAHPDENGAIRHGYYRATPPLSEVEWAAIELGQALGRELEGEIALTRLLTRMIFAYVTESELPLGENLNSVRLIMQNVRAVAKLLLAQKKMEGPEEKRKRVQRELQRMDRELARRENGVWGFEPDEATGEAEETSGRREELSELEKEAVALLALAWNRTLEGEIGLVRVLLRRVLGYMTEAEGLSIEERLRLTDLLIRGAWFVTELLGDERALRPSREEVWVAIMDEVLDDLGEEWGLEI